MLSRGKGNSCAMPCLCCYYSSHGDALDMQLHTACPNRRARLLALAALLALLIVPARVMASEARYTPLVKAVEEARSAIVNIHGEKMVDQTASYPGPADSRKRVNGMGTGVVIDPRGYIVTNYHVVDGVRKIMVTTADRETYVGTIVSHDEASDLAVIKITTPQPLPVIRIGSSNDLMPGETVVAVGNAYGYEHTVTRGIISALHRSVQVSDAQNYEDLIQTDASINPGNSGGPLLNIDGEMIGINVAVRAGAQGIGFAIPVDNALTVAADLLSTRRVDKTWHGLECAASPESSGVVVRRVEQSGPAAAMGLKAGDVVCKVGDIDIVRPLDLERALLGRRVGDTATVAIQRDNQELTLNLVLAELPSERREPTDRVWTTLGLRLEPIPKTRFAQYQTRYRGGLVVTDVRGDGPAAVQGISRGDVLVGMHIWETITMDNVHYILDRPDFGQFDPLKFYILRGSETLYGHMTVAHRPTPTVTSAK